MRLRPELHEIETKTDYCETETKKRSRDLNIMSSNPKNVLLTHDTVSVGDLDR